MKTTIIILKLVMLLVFQPVAASVGVSMPEVNTAYAGETMPADHCPRKSGNHCDHMALCLIVGHFSCDTEVGSASFRVVSGTVNLVTDRQPRAINHYFSFVPGPPLRPPR